MSHVKFVTPIAFGLLLIAQGATTLGCQADSDPAQDEDSAAAADEVVGVTDLALVEKTFGLTADRKVNGQWSRNVAQGACHAAHAADATVQFRRYANGAAFFHAEDATSRDRGRERPVICVDLDSPKLSLDAVALDAIFRFDLGRPTALETITPGEIAIKLQRGQLHVLPTGSPKGPTKAQVDALRGKQGASLVQSPLYIGGRLVDVKVTTATRHFPMSGGQDDGEVTISGSLAAFAYASAFAKSGTAFSLTRDPLGALSVIGGSNTSAPKLRVEAAGDGPGWWQGLYFPIATISESGYYDGVSEYVRTFRVTGPSNPGEGFDENASAECEIITRYANESDTVGVEQPITCKGM